MHRRIKVIISSILCLVTLLAQGGRDKAQGQTIVYPEAWVRPWYEAAPLFRQDTVRIRILGDIMMHASQIENTARGNGICHDFSSFFSQIEEEIRGADIAVGNMEFTLGGKPYTGYPCFSAPDGLETYLADCGFDLFLAANNHIFDKGRKGAERTLAKYRQLAENHGIMFTGLAGDEKEKESQMPLLMLRKGVKIAVINFTYGSNQGISSAWPSIVRISDKEEILDAIGKAKNAGADLIIALPHWGEEYRLKHSRSQENTASWLVEAGVDVIIGTHPHVIQDYQEIHGVPVAYSLGNAVSNMSAPDTQLELMATISLVRDHDGSIRLLKPAFTYLWCSLPGGYNDSYTVIPVAEFIGSRNKWQGSWEYDKMMATYKRVLETSGIPDDGARTEKENYIR